MLRVDHPQRSVAVKQPVEIETVPGVVRASTADLAQALAELIAAEPSPLSTEDDLVEALSIDLDVEGVTGSLTDFSIPAA
jgi:hypothetical protein